jgi:hypothetical protein
MKRLRRDRDIAPGQTSPAATSGISERRVSCPGVEAESSLSDLYKRAKQVGLELCPAEVAPQLRLEYRNQPLGEARSFKGIICDDISEFESFMRT